MAFHITSSAAFAADPHRGVDGAAGSAVANAPRQGSSSIFRRVMGAYVGFSLNTLSRGMRAFSSTPRVASESSLDQDAYMKSIFDLAKHRISGKQGEYDSALRRIQELLNAAPQQTSQPDASDAPPSHGAPPGPAEPPRSGHAHQEPSRQQMQHRHAMHLRRTHEQTGRDNALSLLGGQSAHGDHASGHAPAGGGDAVLLEEIRGLRDRFEASAARPPTRSETDGE